MESVRLIMQLHQIHNPDGIIEYCTETLQKIGILKEDATEGDKIFHVMLGRIINSPSERLTKVSMVTISEPKKVRTVTKGPVEMKIVLDVVNKICSYVLKKAFKSSYGGLAEGNHPWSLFKDLYSEEYKDLIFNEEEEMHGQRKFHTKRYKPVYASSTDYSCATDYFNKEIAEMISNWWMEICGIPKGL